ncbi:A24 family peptidase [Methanocella paludicola]|uniref:A24 family peptidase n=1 Tax=Methanocella paludicola TaxID=570267 RepID=UPI000A77B2DA|nr:A24 family peptidase [Methanocella paludicola]
MESLSFTWIDLACIVLAGLAVAAAAVIDYRTMRIPNRLTIPLIAAGLALMAARGYPLGPAVLTCIVSYAYVYGLWKLRMWGGGDAKLVLGLFLMASPAYPPLYFIAAYSLCLAAVLLLKHGVYRPAVKSRHAGKGGPLSAEDIASLREQEEPMGPALLAACVSSVVLLGAVPW